MLISRSFQESLKNKPFPGGQKRDDLCKGGKGAGRAVGRDFRAGAPRICVGLLRDSTPPNPPFARGGKERGGPSWFSPFVEGEKGMVSRFAERIDPHAGTSGRPRPDGAHK
jgi:hypothetical protein